MSGIRSKNRRQGHTVVPNWRWEDQSLTPIELRVAGWLASHADDFRVDHVSRNLIASKVGISPDSASKAVHALVGMGLLELHRGQRGRFVIEFDFAVWSTPRPSSTDSTGYPLDGERPVGERPVTGRSPTGDWTVTDHIEEQGEEQRETPQTPPPAGGRKRRSRRGPPEPLTPLERSHDFDAWWDAWPKKVGRLDAVRAWRDMLGHLPDIEQLIGAAAELYERTRREKSAETAEWQQFFPHPATWLRRGDYLDFDVVTAAPKESRHPCVLCGVSDPCVERCQGVEVGQIDDVATECVWR